ncbi:unnamed protein product [Sphacelaria rigidula]
MSARPSLGAAGGRKAEFCAAHAPAGMVDVRRKRCGKEGCSTRPSFGAAGGRKAEFCAAHAPAGMVGVRSKRCGKEGCSTRPSLGATGGRKAEFCATRSRAGMVNVRSRGCGEEGSEHPSFGAAGGREAKFCASQRCSKRVRDRQYKCRRAAHSLAVASDVRHVQGKNHPNDNSVVGESGVNVDERGGRHTHPSDAGPNANDGCRSANVCCGSRAMRSRRRVASPMTTLPVASRQPPGAAPADEISSDGAQTRMKTNIEMTAASPRDFDGKRTSGELVTAPPSSRHSMSDGGSIGTTIRGSCHSGIARGKSTKRLRRTVQVEPVLDVAAGNDETSEEEGGDVKLELVGRVCSLSLRVRGIIPPAQEVAR